MKRLLSLLLAALALLALPMAQAAETEPLETKLQKQLANGSGLKLSVAFADGAELPSVGGDEAAQGLLEALLPGSTLSLEHLKAAFGSQKGRQELTLRLTRGESEITGLTYRSDATLETLETPLLPGARYAAAAGEGLFLPAVSENGSRWPGLERLLLAIVTADGEWSSRASALYAPYTTEITAWMQPFTNVETATGENGVTTTTNISVAPGELKSEIKKLARKFLADGALLSLLKEKLTAREAAAYLDPASLAQFEAAIDAFPLDENITATRVFGRDGKLAEDTVYLPLSGAMGLASLRYHMRTLPDGRSETAVTLAKAVPAGDTVELRYLSKAPGENEKAFDCEGTCTAKSAGQETVLGFAAAGSIGETAYDRSTDTATAPFSLSLRLAPEGQGAYTLGISGTLTSKSNARSATRIAGELVWQEEGSQRKLTAAVTGQSAAPWAIPVISGDGLTRLDSMTGQELAGLLPKLLQEAAQGLSALVLRLNGGT